MLICCQGRECERPKDRRDDSCHVHDLFAENKRQQADIDKMLSERQGWLDEIERLRAALEGVAAAGGIMEARGIAQGALINEQKAAPAESPNGQSGA